MAPNDSYPRSMNQLAIIYRALVSSVAEELTNSNFMEWSTRVVGPHGVDFVHVSRTFNEWFNVELWPLPAHGSRAGMWAACLVDLKWNGGRARTQ